MGLMRMYDATPDGVPYIPRDAQAVAGYVDGHYISFHMLVERFYPHAHCLSIAVWPGSIAAVLDIEPGNPVRTPQAVRANFNLRKAHGVYRPCFYADVPDMHNIVIPGLRGIPRHEYRLWLADWNGRQDTMGFDAHQFTSLPEYDISVLAGDFFPPPPKRRIIPKPAPKPKQPAKPVKSPLKPHPKVVGGTTGGALGVALTAILTAAGVHITPEVAGAISTIATFLAGFATPAP